VGGMALVGRSFLCGYAGKWVEWVDLCLGRGEFL
jgi:hypothetical protein